MRKVTTAAILIAFLHPAKAADVPSTRELSELSLEALADMEVTSVSRRAERLSDAPASIFVITAEQIRRSGAASLPEALRLAPNLQVAQVSASAYNIRARGINNNSANKLLVLIDGRSVYSPLFSGVFWDVQDLILEDVERIEVVSGPGGTLWGVNAVNGVINVTTRSARATQGGLLVAGGGNRESTAAARYGAAAGTGHYRVYGKYFDRDSTSTASGDAADDAAHLAQTGFRADWQDSRDELAIHGNVYSGTIGQPRPGSISISGVNLALAPIPVSGANLAARWARKLEGGSEVVLHAYLDRTERTVPPTFAEKLDILDAQIQHLLRWSGYSLTWGAEYRLGRDRVVNGQAFAFLPASLDQRWGSLFAQGEAAVRDDLRVTVGARFERNDYTGTEFLPALRAAWKMTDDDLLWAAASRTVRAPSRLDRDAFVPATPPFLLAGGPDVRSEIAKVYELGYRGSMPNASYSVTLFCAEYDRLHTQEIAPSRTFLFFSGGMEASTCGVEMWGSWQPRAGWRLSAGYTAQHEDFRLKPESNDAAAPGTAGRDPARTWLARSSHNLAHSVELDVAARGVAALSNPTVPRYWTVDLRVGWKPTSSLELAIAARNLADGGHGEFTSVETRTEIGWSVYVSLNWQFDAR